MHDVCVCLAFELCNRELMCFFSLCPRTSNVVWISRYNLPVLFGKRRYLYIYKKKPHWFRSETDFHSDIIIYTCVCAVIDKIYNNMFNRSEILYTIIYGRLYSIQMIYDQTALTAGVCSSAVLLFRNLYIGNLRVGLCE